MSPSKAVWAQKGDAVLLGTMAEGPPAEQGLCRGGAGGGAGAPGCPGRQGGAGPSVDVDPEGRIVFVAVFLVGRLWPAGSLSERSGGSALHVSSAACKTLPYVREKGRAPGFVLGSLGVSSGSRVTLSQGSYMPVNPPVRAVLKYL